MPDQKKIIAIGGVTCSGKTETSLELSKHFPVEIVNFDSICFYRYFDIGTAKPDMAARAVAAHNLVDIKNPDEEYNAGMFSEDAGRLIRDITNRGNIPLFTGGTGLYMKSLIYGLSSIPEIDKTFYRKKILELIEELGLNAVYEKLKEIDPDYAAVISAADKQRIARAYEVYEATGRPLSHYLKENPFGEPLYDCLYFTLIPPKDYLKSCIMERTKKILAKGLIGEINEILNMGYSRHLKPFRSIGYKEGLMYLNKEIKTEDDLYSAIVSSTMKYAKRQATFFKKVKNATEVNLTDLNKRVAFMSKLIGDFIG